MLDTVVWHQQTGVGKTVDTSKGEPIHSLEMTTSRESDLASLRIAILKNLRIADFTDQPGPSEPPIQQVNRLVELVESLLVRNELGDVDLAIEVSQHAAEWPQVQERSATK